MLVAINCSVAAPFPKNMAGWYRTAVHALQLGNVPGFSLQEPSFFLCPCLPLLLRIVIYSSPSRQQVFGEEVNTIDQGRPFHSISLVVAPCGHIGDSIIINSIRAA